MNILFVTAVLPYPLHSGGQIRIYNLLKRLSAHHAITLVSFIRSPEEEKYIKELSFCASVYTVMRGRAYKPAYIVKALTGSYSWLLETYNNQNMQKLLDSLLSSYTFDVVHIEPFYVWPSLPGISIPLVVCEHNVEYEIYERYADTFPLQVLRPAMRHDTQKLKTWEQKAWRVAKQVVCVSDSDAQAVSSYLSFPVSVVPNGVDIEEYNYKTHDYQALKFLFVGNFRWVPNQEAVNTLLSDIWPRIQAKYEKATLRIVGKNMPAVLRGKVGMVQSVYDESVENIQDAYNAASVLIAPHAIGGGTKFKILESFAAGLPVITTTEGIQGIDAQNQKHFLEANSVAETVEQVAQLLDIKKMKTMTKNARLLVEKKYDWNSIAKKLDVVWANAYEQH